MVTAAIYVPCYVYPWLRTCFQYGTSQRAHIFVEENGFTRITIPANFHWRPGQHCFLRFTSFGVMSALSTHPFTICSSPSMNPDVPSELVFYIRHQGGFTARLYARALEHPDVSVPVLVDGPYGGADLQRYRDSDHVLVVAGGSGAGWCLPFVERFLRSAVPQASLDGPKHDQGVATGDIKEAPAVEEPSSHRPFGPQSLRIILATRDISSRTWFLRTVGELLSKYTTVQVSHSLRVQVYLTGDAAHEVDLTSSHAAHNHNHSKSSPTPSNSSIDRIEIPVKGHDEVIPGKEYAEGRPHLPTIIAEETARSVEAGESLGVYVCGPDTMQNDVRNAVAEENLRIVKGGRSGGVYLHSEHFSWA